MKTPRTVKRALWLSVGALMLTGTSMAAFAQYRIQSSTSARYILDHYHNGESPNIPDTPKEMRRDMKWMKPLEARAASKPATPFRTAGIALDLAGLGLGAAALAYGKRRQSSPAV